VSFGLLAPRPLRSAISHAARASPSRHAIVALRHRSLHSTPALPAPSAAAVWVAVTSLPGDHPRRRPPTAAPCALARLRHGGAGATGLSVGTLVRGVSTSEAAGAGDVGSTPGGQQPRSSGHLSSSVGAVMMAGPALQQAPAAGGKAARFSRAAGWRIALAALAATMVAASIALQPAPLPPSDLDGGDVLATSRDGDTSGTAPPGMPVWRLLTGQRFPGGATPAWMRQGRSPVAISLAAAGGTPWLHPKSLTSVASRAVVAAVAVAAAAAPPGWRFVPLLLTLALAALLLAQFGALLAVALGPAADSAVPSPWVPTAPASSAWAVLAAAPIWAWMVQSLPDAAVAVCAWSYRERLVPQVQVAWQPRRALLRRAALRAAVTTAAAGAVARAAARDEPHRGGAVPPLRPRDRRPVPLALAPAAAANARQHGRGAPVLNTGGAGDDDDDAVDDGDGAPGGRLGASGRGR
jgi:hypothetical protein